MTQEIDPADVPEEEPPLPPDRAEHIRQLLGLITEPDFAAAMGVEFRTAQSKRALGKQYPPFVRFGRGIVLPIETTREWLRQQAEGVSLEVVHRRPPKRRR